MSHINYYFDTLINQYGPPQFIKIDVEGYELEVLRGLSRSVPALSFEFTPELLPMAYGCMAHLVSIGMNEFNYSLGETMVLALDQWVDARRMMDIFHQAAVSRSFFGDIYARKPTTAATG